MILFTSENCVNCKALRNQVDVTKVAGLQIFHLPAAGVPLTDEDVNALAEADLREVHQVPVLIDDNENMIVDLFEIAEILKKGVV